MSGGCEEKPQVILNQGFSVQDRMNILRVLHKQDDQAYHLGNDDDRHKTIERGRERLPEIYPAAKSEHTHEIQRRKKSTQAEPANKALRKSLHSLNRLFGCLKGVIFYLVHFVRW